VLAASLAVCAAMPSIKAMLSLDFVDKVTANIKNHNCTVALINKYSSLSKSGANGT